jgi:hypothetical protein
MPIGESMKMIVPLVLILLCACNQKSLTDQVHEEQRYREEKLIRSIGRYQYVPNTGGYYNHGRIIDTATGRIWMDNCYRSDPRGGKCLESAWTEEDVIGITVKPFDYYEYLAKNFPERK